MTSSSDPGTSRLRAALAATLTQPQVLALLPALTLGAYWLGGEQALFAVALFVPVVFALSGLMIPPEPVSRPTIDHITGLPLRDAAVDALEDTLTHHNSRGMTTACVAISLEGLSELSDRFGTPAGELALRRVGERLAGALRGADVLVRLDGASFAAALGPTRRADLETLLQIAGRLQDAVREPISIDATTAYLSCSIGFCLPNRSPSPKGEALLAAAETAMREARSHGPGAIRAFTSEMQSAIALRHDLIDDVSEALEAGHIRPWFQPQISTDTGQVTGFEALARWLHTDHGMIPPSDFLTTIEQAGLSERLSEEILFHAFSALRSWDKAGLNIPTVGVNFSGDELRNPKLVERIKWELDRFNLHPDRLTVEVLETVVSDSGDDVITRNIAALAELGCGIDLDDFGTGNASIAAIRRFAIGRLKIDRSFITHVDQDRDQQDMVAAILTMSERLGLQTLAEGVETTGEHTMLAQLGCGHIQGFGIARPMPFEETIAWARKHQDKLVQAPRVGRQAG